MFKKLLIALFLLMLPTLASAQSQRNPCYYTGANPQSGSVGCVPVSTINPLPVTSAGGGGGTSSSFGSAFPSTGTAAGAKDGSGNMQPLNIDGVGNLKTAGSINVTPTDCSGTVTTGGTAQNAFNAGATKHGFTVVNIDTSEPLWISFTGTATVNTVGSYPIAAATATTFANAGSFTTPPGMGLNTALSVVAATTGHKWSCTWW